MADQLVKLSAHGVTVGVKRDNIDFSGSGDNTIIAAIPGRIIKIHKLVIIGEGASNIRFWSGPSSENSPLSGLLPFGGNFGFVYDGDEFPTETLAGKAFVISSTAAIQIGGMITYRVY